MEMEWGLLSGRFHVQTLWKGVKDGNHFERIKTISTNIQIHRFFSNPCHELMILLPSNKQDKPTNKQDKPNKN